MKQQFNRYIVLLLAVILLPLAASAQGTGSVSAPVYHPEIEQDMGVAVNALRAMYGIAPIELISSAEGQLPSGFYANRDCMMNMNANSVIRDGGHLKHDDYGICAQSGSQSNWYLGPEVLGYVGSSAAVGTTVLGLGSSNAHRPYLLSDADQMIIYTACYTSPGSVGEHTISMIAFGKSDGSQLTLNYSETAVRLAGFPTELRDRNYHGCNNGSSTPTPPANSVSTPASVPASGGSSTPIGPTVAAGEPSYNPAVPQLWYRFQVGRLYSAYFNRYPDTQGWVYWNNQFKNGMGLGEMSDYFSTSQEFRTTYGAKLTNSQFIGLVYNNVLGRASDESGKNYWLSQMSNGMTRGELMIYFAESSEFIIKAGPTVTGTCWDGTPKTSYACASLSVPGLS